jgi:hypothetical protein
MEMESKARGRGRGVVIPLPRASNRYQSLTFWRNPETRVRVISQRVISDHQQDIRNTCFDWLPLLHQVTHIQLHLKYESQ